MLNRIRVRGKLFLLLTTPLLALIVVASLGILDRVDTATAQGREERIALLADAGSDLAQAITHERLVGLMDDSGADVDPASAAAATRKAMTRWLRQSEATASDLANPDTIINIDRLVIRLQARLDRQDQGAGSATSLLADLSIMSRSIAEINDSLVTEASDLDLYRALFVHGHAGAMQSAAAEIALVGADAINVGELSEAAELQLAAADLRLARATNDFREQAGPTFVETLADMEAAGTLPRASRASETSRPALDPLVTTSDAASRAAWLQLGVDRVDGIHGLSDALLADASLIASNRAGAASDTARSFLILALSVIIAAVIMAVLIGRSISRPLIRLSRSAQQLSQEELPALVESLRTGGRLEAPQLRSIEWGGRDEVAQLSSAIAEIQKVTVEVAEEQASLLNRGISEMFVNLARRNQSLLDRQIEFIDGLEAVETDPDQLENLFQLDHLATRMRRNAESLLVLAGGEPVRRRGEPVRIGSVARVAIGEIDDYPRINLRQIDDALVPTAAAVDLAHLLSELMENATQFSPPETRVDLVGHRTVEGAYQFTIIDHGLGMTTDKISEANEILAEPPIVGLDMGRSLGFTVVGKLAERLGLAIRLTPTPEGGLTAVVTVPTTLLVAEDAEPEVDEVSVDLADELPSVDDQAVAAAIATENLFPEPEPLESTDDTLEELNAEPGPDDADSMPAERGKDLFDIFGTPAAAEVAEPPVGDDIFAGVAVMPPDGEAELWLKPRPEPAPETETVAEAEPASPMERISKLPPPPSLRPRPEAPSVAPASPEPPTRQGSPDEPTSGVTSAGLQRRQPGKSSMAPTAPGKSDSPAAQSGRTPEEVRDMLSRYRDGRERGRSTDADSGTDSRGES